MKTLPEIDARHDYWIGLRHDFHAHPELAFEERRTAARVASELERMGLDVATGIGGTGVVGTLQRGDGPCIGLRADMDALPMTEGSGVPYCSQVEGRAHACGHDGHTVMLLAAAEYLSQHGDFNGTVRFIFQPAEEVAGGARVMIADGLFERFPVEAVFGLHNWPPLEVGGFRIRPGTMLASLDCFDIDVTGTGAHGAMPHEGIDSIAAASAIIANIQTIVSRNIDPQQTGVISITKIQAGDAYNVIPEQAALGGGIRCFDPAVREQLRTRLKEVATATARAYGAQAEVRFNSEYPPVINAADETALALDVAAGLVGHDAVQTDVDPILGSEDFSYMLAEKPGCYIMLGTGTEHMVHHPDYDFNDAAIPLGATYWARLVPAWFGMQKERT